MPLAVEIHPVTPFQQNCSLVWCTQTGEAALVDPGGEVDRLLAAVAARGLRLVKLLLTHGHLDHASGVAELQQRLGLVVEGPHRDDEFWIDALPAAAAQYGFPPAQAFTPSRWLQHGDTVELGVEKLEVLHCPGHTPGHVVFVHRVLAHWGAAAVRYEPAAHVDHLEVSSARVYFRKALLYGRSARRYVRVVRARPLATHERLHIFRETVRQARLGSGDAMLLFSLLAIGVGFYWLGWWTGGQGREARAADSRELPA